MSILSFVTQDELDNLSEDPRIAFMELINHAQRRLSEQISKFDPDNSYDSAKRFDAEKSFMNVVVAAGKTYGVEPFSSMEVPKHQSFSGGDYEQFKSDLDHYVTQLILTNSMRARGASVDIKPEDKDRIRAYINGLRECIERSDIEPRKMKALLDKLQDFNNELEKRRVSFTALALLAIAFVGAPGSVGETAALIHNLVNKITVVFAESKQVEDQTRQIGPQAAPKSLSAPRRPDETPKKQPSWDSGQGDGLDDEIPF